MDIGNISCELSGKCWRLGYTLYLLKYPEKEPPIRQEILLEGFINPSCFPSGGIRCKKLPIWNSGILVNECPDSITCEDYMRHMERTKREKERNPRIYRPNIPIGIRREVAKRSNYKCVYCCRNINTISPITGERLGGAIDHFIPLSQGGSSELSNLVLACHECNGKKSDKIWPKKLL